jgi:cell division septation protein DedD
MMDPGSVRHLEQIQEQENEPRTPRATSVALIVLGGACVAFAALALGGHKSNPTATLIDPLGELVAQHARGSAAAPARGTDLSPHDVTFPGLLSDDKSPTTALAAVRPVPAASSLPNPATVTSVVPSPPSSPPPPTDRLSVIPLPAQSVLEATPVITRPRDALTKAASDSGQIVTAAAPSAGPGHDGGYQLQVSSFRTQGEANDFADQLRARGHRSYVQEAHVPGRGTWFRVRVGPFSTQHAAAAYRVAFEAKEHVVPFIVLPTAKDGAGQGVPPAAPRDATR